MTVLTVVVVEETGNDQCHGKAHVLVQDPALGVGDAAPRHISHIMRLPGRTRRVIRPLTCSPANDARRGGSSAQGNEDQRLGLPSRRRQRRSEESL